MFSFFSRKKRRKARARQRIKEEQQTREAAALLNDGDSTDGEAEIPARGLKKETRHSVLAVLFFLIAILFSLALFGAAGPAGAFVAHYGSILLGAGFVLLPIAFLFAGLVLVQVIAPHIVLRTTIAGGSFLLFGLALIDTLFRKTSDGIVSGGIFGHAIASPFISLFETIYGSTVLAALVLISLLVLFDARLSFEPALFGFSLRRQKNENNNDVTEIISASGPVSTNIYEDVAQEAVEGRGTDQFPASVKQPDEKLPVMKTRKRWGAYIPPPLSLLVEDSEKPSVGDIKANANLIKRTLQNFGIDVEMDEIAIGPSVTRYALKPAEGVKLSRIVGLQNELSLALAAHPLRIEAPIPGKSLVGIEIPNKVKATVRLRTLLASKDFQESPHPLLIALGRGTSGVSAFTNVGKAPHLLIAGSTGSGKSVTIHTIITSLLYRNGPEELRLIMIDPKRVELTLYNKIPHLLTPVITDPKKAILALKWAAKEMSRRYDVLESESVRDIQSYHKNIVGDGGENSNDASSPERMPYIVIILDELADMMSSYPREFEAAIVRLAQMSRAVGIHLVLSTQRPSVEVITGLIKANVPSRIALQVPSQIDSRTILDMPGAEKLLGAGDMLFLGGDMAKPARYQSPYISEGEVKSVVDAIAKANEALPDDALAFAENGGNVDNLGVEDPIFSSMDNTSSSANDEDDLYDEAKKIVIETGKASTSFIQRRLKVGYARAARLLDMLEERGIVGPGNGAKAREIYKQNTIATTEPLSTEMLTEQKDELPEN